jgi:hypothetical protein
MQMSACCRQAGKINCTTFFCCLPLKTTRCLSMCYSIHSWRPARYCLWGFRDGRLLSMQLLTLTCLKPFEDWTFIRLEQSISRTVVG